MVQLKQTAKQIAINTAKVASHEASETLKSIKSQVGLEVSQEKKQPEAKQPDIEKAKHDQSVRRQMAGLERELEDIKNLKLQKKRQELQAEQMRLQEEARKKENNAPAPVESKKGRRMGGAIKKAKSSILSLIKSRSQQQTETRQPPSS